MKKLITNLRKEHRDVKCEAKINKQKVRPLYWFFEADGGNSPLKYIKRSNRAGFNSNSSSRGKSNTGPDGKGSILFRLSVCGLDKFKVKVGLKRDGSDKTDNEQYEVWRRLYYSASYMKGTQFSAFGPVKAEYKKHGVEFKDVPGKEGKYKHVCEKNKDMKLLLGMIPKVSKPHLEARLLFVDRLWREEFQSKTKFLGGAKSATLKFKHYVWAVGDFIEGTVSGPHIGSLDIKPFAKRSGMNVILNFSSIPRIAAAAPGSKLADTYTIDVKVRLAHILNGFAKEDGRIVIARRGIKKTGRPDKDVQGTIVHEVGHAFGLVPAKVQEYNEFNGNPIPAANNPFPTHYYLNPNGDHCSTGASGTKPNFEKGTCVMFHYSHNGRGVTFCGNCGPVVTRANVTAYDADGIKWPAV